MSFIFPNTSLIYSNRNFQCTPNSVRVLVVSSQFINSTRLRGDDLWLPQYQYRLIVLPRDLRVGYAVPHVTSRDDYARTGTTQRTADAAAPDDPVRVCACVRYRRINCSIIVSPPSVGFTDNCRACAVRAHPYLKWNRIIFTSKLYQTTYGCAAHPVLLADKSVIIAPKRFVCLIWWLWQHLK